MFKKFIDKFFKKTVNIKDSWVTEPSKKTDVVDFLDWFDSTDSVASTKSRAKIDWEKRISNFSQFSTLNKLECLEIGFGGGRLIMQAAKSFKVAKGIDIHSEFERVRHFLESYECYNYKLIHRDNHE